MLRGGSCQHEAGLVHCGARESPLDSKLYSKLYSTLCLCKSPWGRCDSESGFIQYGNSSLIHRHRILRAGTLPSPRAEAVIKMAENDLEARVAAVEKLVKVFAFERRVYAFATLVGFLLALYATLRVLFQGPQGFLETGFPMLGGSGIMGVCTLRIIKLFSDSLAMVAGRN
jgi:hypothetical protein